mmetsp:Transcript_14308/g.41711  ORF Transcript_14308/g.41711 Transcript_14308/m.41711 type:complete len:137 (-) Transcript_14308:1658-2068(-)
MLSCQVSALAFLPGLCLHLLAKPLRLLCCRTAIAQHLLHLIILFHNEVVQVALARGTQRCYMQQESPRCVKCEGCADGQVTGTRPVAGVARAPSRAWPLPGVAPGQLLVWQTPSSLKGQLLVWQMAPSAERMLHQA